MENSGELVHLPEDITSEILRRLPVESLLRFRCVCKSWWDLIQSAQFVESHANDVNRCARAIFFKKRRRKERFFGFNGEDEVDKFKKIKLSELTDLGEDYQIHGHCNGVICLSLVDSISLWNPALRQCRVLPPTRIFPLNYFDKLGFGYDSANRDYKVVNFPRKCGMSEMYSLKSNSWKPIHCDHLRFLEYKLFYTSPRGCGCSFKGRLHWIVIGDPRGGRKGRFLVVFDFTEEKFLEFDIPESVPENHGTLLYHSNLGVFKGRLSWLMPNSSREYEIWSSEDDSCTPESWTRVWKCSQEALQFNNGVRVLLMQLTEDENVLMKTDYHHGNGFVHLYDFRMKCFEVRTTVPDDPCLCLPITNFVETLVSIMPETATVPTSSGRWNCSEDDESSVYAMP